MNDENLLSFAHTHVDPSSLNLVYPVLEYGLRTQQHIATRCAAVSDAATSLAHLTSRLPGSELTTSAALMR